MVTLTSYSTSFVHFSAMTSSTGVRSAIASAKQRTPRSARDTVMRATRAEAIQRVGCSSALAVGVLLAPRRAIAEEMKDEVEQFDEMRGQIEKKGKEDVVRGGMLRPLCIQYSTVGDVCRGGIVALHCQAYFGASAGFVGVASVLCYSLCCTSRYFMSHII